MGSEGSPAGSPGTAAAGPDGAAARLVGVFLFPARTLRSVARRPGWVLPLAVCTALSFLVGELVFSRANWEATIREGAARSHRTLSQAQVDAAVERVRGLVWVYEALAAAAPAAVALATAGVMWSACRAFGWELDFRQSFGITAHAFLPGALVSAALLAILWGRNAIDVGGLDALVPTNAGTLVERQAAPGLHSLLASLDALSFWTMALLVLGLSEATGVTKSRMTGLVLGLWGLYVLGKAGVAVLLS
jgi:hypothetical protein